MKSSLLIGMFIAAQVGYSMEDIQLWDGNQISNWWSNTGRITSHIPSGDAGLTWPKDSSTTAIFCGGFWLLAGRVDGVEEIRTAIVDYTSEFTPGLLADTMDNDSNRIYTLTSEDGPSSQDWQSWPVQQGAPWIDEDNNGEWNPDIDTPAIKGDQFAWSVMHDGYQPNHANYYNTQPLGVEVRTSVYGVDQSGPLGNTIYYEWDIKNAGEHQLDSVFVCVWMDPDIGSAIDDYAGTDPELDMAYAFNAGENDRDYGHTPPAVGFAFIRTPLIPATGETGYNVHGEVPNTQNVDMSSMLVWRCGDAILCGPDNRQEAYWQMHGIDNNGDPIVSPQGDTTSFMYTGFPETNSGWLDDGGNPGGDRYFLLSAGPFSLTPGESQDLIGALSLTADTNHTSAVAMLRTQMATVSDYWATAFETTSINASSWVQPSTPYLKQNYPNPFNPSTNIKYTIPQDLDVVFTIFDIKGREVKYWIKEDQQAGSYQLDWNGLNQHGQQVATGVYFGHLQAGEYQRTIKMVLIR